MPANTVNSFSSNFLSMKKLLVSLVIFNIFIASGQSIRRLDNSTISAANLDKKISDLMKSAQVHGLAVAVFNNNNVVYKKTFGYGNATTKHPISEHSNFYGASLSKAVFAVLVLKLVEEGKLDLDKPLQEYLPKPVYEYKPTKKWHDNYEDLRVDSLYRKITARMCLAHTSGFPNWRWDNQDQKLRVLFEPGTRYGYSGEGMVYLQVVLEHLFEQPLEKMMQEKVFGPAGMKSSAYSWRPEFEKDFVFGHGMKGEILEKDKDNDPRSASTLETTLYDYVQFTEAVLQNKLISPASRKLMFSPQLRLRSIQQHGPLRFKDSTLNDGIRLASGLGWILLQSPHGIGALKEGHGDGFQHYTILFPDKGTGIVILGNSDNAESIFKELLEVSIGDVYTPWYWENYIPYNAK